MADPANVDTVHTISIGMPGRALNSARTQHFILDSSSGPSEALTNSEAFLAGISSCGVTLIEKYAQQAAVPLRRIAVTITGARSATPARFDRIEMRFEMAGVGQEDAEKLVAIWQER